MSTSVVERRELRYEGKAKRVHATDDPGLVILEFTDQATAFNGEKRAAITNKGQLNAAISTAFMELLAEAGIPTHFVERRSATEQLVANVEIIPLEVIVRNVVAGSLAARLGLAEGTVLRRPVVEFCYKRDDLGDPLLTRAHIDALALASPSDVDRLEQLALRIDDVLVAELAQRGVTLVDFKLEFGRSPSGVLVLADEVSPDTCRFWDVATGERLDKDRFRRDLGGVEEAYAELLRRIVGPDAANRELAS